MSTKSTSLKLHGISAQLLVRDLEKSISFYTEMLGFNIDFRYEKFYAGISNDGQSIHLKKADPNREERVSKRINEHLDLIFYVADVDAAYNSVGGAAVVQPLRTMPYGREFYLSDPDGYLIGVMEVI